MTKAELIRAYSPEPVTAVLILSILLNIFGKSSLSDFMHTEAHDALSLFTVLLGASLALWIGLFWISSSEFGQWLASRMVLETINVAYITSITILLIASLACIFCAYVSQQHVAVQLIGLFACVYGLATLPMMLNNTHKLLKLHGMFGRQRSNVMDMKTTNAKSAGGSS